MRVAACAACLRRSVLVARLGGFIEIARRGRPGGGRPAIEEILGLDDDVIIGALAGDRADEVEHSMRDLDVRSHALRIEGAGMHALCRCDDRYPARMRALGPSQPAVLHVLGDLVAFTRAAAAPSVAIVGSRRPSSHGCDVAHELGRTLSLAGVVVVSGMAMGIDGQAQEGAAAVGPTVAVLAGPADVPYPARHRSLHARIASGGAVISEAPPGSPSWRWSFVARNRTIAALSELTVVVEAAERSGSLVTAAIAREIGREVGAVPGWVTSPVAAGANALLKDGAHVIRHATDVLDVIGLETAGETQGPSARHAGLPPALRGVLDLVAAGEDTPAAVTRRLGDARAALIALGELEALGVVDRRAGGRYRLV